MRETPSRETLSALTERLAEIEHNRWRHWQRYLHGQCNRGGDGALTIPSDLVARWERQIATPYESLTEKEKESDREQVRKYLPAVLDSLGFEAEGDGDT